MGETMSAYGNFIKMLTMASGIRGIFNGTTGGTDLIVNGYTLPGTQLKDIDALRSYNGNATAIYITGYSPSNAPSQIAGDFTRDDTDTTTPDDGLNVIVDVSGRRWKREFGGAVSPADLAAVNTQLADYAALRAYNGTLKAVYITGYLATSAPSGIAGYFTRDDSDTTSADNGGTIIVASNGKRWKRRYTGAIQVAWFGVDAAGNVDATAAANAAIAVGGANSVIEFPIGTTLITGTLNILNDRVEIRGASSWASRILFAPTANATCIKFIKSNSSVSYQGKVKNITLYSNESTYKKIGIDLVDTSWVEISDVVITGSVAGALSSYYWSGNGSVGIQTHGREQLTVRKINIFADNPVQISTNPNNAISLDHAHFSDCMLCSNGGKVITVDSGVNLTHITFDGYQAWVGGTDGFYWVDTTSSQSSIGLRFDNVRYEQATGTGYQFRIEHNYLLDQISIINCYGGLNTNGTRLRKCKEISVNNLFYSGSLIGFDVDSTCDTADIRNLNCNNNAATVNITSTRTNASWRIGGNIYDLARNAPSGSNVSQQINPSATLGFNQLEPKTFTVPANSVIDFSSNKLRAMVLLFNTTAPNCAIISILGTAGVCRIVNSDVTNYYSGTAATNSVSIYYDAPSSKYKIQNNTASSLTFFATAMGASDR